jgi:hypothetical protein
MIIKFNNMWQVMKDYMKDPMPLLYDKINKEFDDNYEWIESDMKKYLKEEPANFQKLKNVRFYNWIEWLKKELLKDFKRSDDVGLWNTIK